MKFAFVGTPLFWFLPSKKAHSLWRDTLNCLGPLALIWTNVRRKTVKLPLMQIGDGRTKKVILPIVTQEMIGIRLCALMARHVQKIVWLKVLMRNTPTLMVSKRLEAHYSWTL